MNKVEQFDCAICLTWKQNIESFYAQMTKYIGRVNGKSIVDSRTLHRFIMDAQEDEVIDHINFNTLDNRRANLRRTVNEKNLRNRNGKNSNNSSGYRNVCWINGRWVVQLQVNGKNTRLGSFENASEAGEFAEKMREKYYGEFAGRSNTK